MSSEQERLQSVVGMIANGTSRNGKEISNINTSANADIFDNPEILGTPNLALLYNGMNNNVNEYDNNNVSIWKSGDDHMNADDLLKSYMDKIDNDQRDLKAEMREREERMIKATVDSEARMDARLERIEKLIEKQNADANEKFIRMEDKFDGSVKDIKENKISIWGICIATILSVAGLAYAAIQVFQSFVSLVTLQ